MSASGDKKDYYIVTVEDQVIQLTSYIVRADDAEHARRLVSEGVYAFESESEVIDTIESSIKTVEGIYQ